MSNPSAIRNGTEPRAANRSLDAEPPHENGCATYVYNRELLPIFVVNVPLRLRSGRNARTFPIRVFVV